MQKLIPKVIHYCWFGRNEKSRAVLRCIESWKRLCPDYEITEWNEDNFDIACIPFVKEAYETGKWAFVTDYARLKIVYENGGIYLDTDVELIKPLDELLHLQAYAGFQGEEYVATGLGFGAEKGNAMIGELMADYHSISFSKNADDLIKIACPVVNTKVFKTHGLVADGKMQTVNGVTVFPREYFDPKDSETYELKVTENTVSIHHYDASWKGMPSGFKQRIIGVLVKLLGKERFLRLKAKIK